MISRPAGTRVPPRWGNNQGCLRCDPLSSREMSPEASLTADSTESHSIIPGLSAVLEAYITEGRKRTGVMTCLFLFFSSFNCHSRAPNTMKFAKRKSSESPGLGGHAGLLPSLFLPERRANQCPLPHFSFKILF